MVSVSPRKNQVERRFRNGFPRGPTLFGRQNFTFIFLLKNAGEKNIWLLLHVSGLHLHRCSFNQFFVFQELMRILMTAPSTTAVQTACRTACPVRRALCGMTASRAAPSPWAPLIPVSHRDSSTNSSTGSMRPRRIPWDTTNTDTKMNLKLRGTHQMINCWLIQPVPNFDVRLMTKLIQTYFVLVLVLQTSSVLVKLEMQRKTSCVARTHKLTTGNPWRPIWPQKSCSFETFVKIDCRF